MNLFTLAGTASVRRQYLSKQFMESQDLCNKDSKTNVNARNEAQEASQVLGGDLTEVHRHHTERDTCGVGKKV